MKNKEKLSEHLTNVDEDIISKAYEIDDPEKLKKYKESKNIKGKRPPMIKIVAIAASFALVIGAVFSAPALIKTLTGAPNEDLPWEETEGFNVLPPFDGTEDGSVMINSIAKLSYYAAMRMVAPEEKTSALNSEGYGIALLSAGYGTDRRDDPPEPEITVEEGETNKPGPYIPDDPVIGEDIYYYALDPEEPFYIDKVSMFRIELTDENGFLASKLGLGVVDVVIAEDCIWGESLITFRRGENFYSCLTNGWGYDWQTGNTHWDFSTHKYVEGFYIVKNLAKENYGFNIYMDAEGQAISFICDESENGGLHVDKDVKIVSSTVISNEGRSFTVAELEDYFNSGNIPDNTEAILPEGSAETIFDDQN